MEQRKDIDEKRDRFAFCTREAKDISGDKAELPAETKPEKGVEPSLSAEESSRSCEESLENDLLLQAQAGGRDAAETLLRKYLPMVRTRAKAFARNGPDVQDLVQEGLLALFSAIRAYRPEKGVRFRGFASACVNNKMRNILAAYYSGKNAPMRDFFSLEEGQAWAMENSRYSPENMVIAQEEWRQLRHVEQSLTPLELAVFRGYLGGQSYADMAKGMGCSIKSVDNAMQRIRKKIRKLQGDLAQTCDSIR